MIIEWKHPSGASGKEVESDPDMARIIAESALSDGCEVTVDGEPYQQEQRE